MKKINLPSELVYFLSIIIISFAVAMVTAADFGISMIVAPAYIVSQKLGISFGVSEYLIQGVLFIGLCCAMKGFKPLYLFSFITCLIYGAFLDLWRYIIPAFNPTITNFSQVNIVVRIVFLVVGEFLTTLAVALSFKTYLYAQVYDFFVKGISEKYNIKTSKFKFIFDICCLLVGVVLTLVLFKCFIGIGWGTLLMALCNGGLIGLFSKLYDKFFVSTPLLKKLAKHFE